MMHRNWMNYLTWFGFAGWTEFVTSTIKPKLFMKTWFIIVMLGPVFAWIEDMTGLAPSLFIGFALLNLIEWVTGIRASVAEGKPVSSLKMHRFFLKVATYLVVMGILRQYSMHAGGKLGDNAASVFYDWTFWAVFNYISLILTRSIFENLHRMGVKEASKIYAILDNKVTRFLAYIVAPPDTEKTER